MADNAPRLARRRPASPTTGSPPRRQQGRLQAMNNLNAAPPPAPLRRNIFSQYSRRQLPTTPAFAVRTPVGQQSRRTPSPPQQEEDLSTQQLYDRHQRHVEQARRRQLIEASKRMPLESLPATRTLRGVFKVPRPRAVREKRSRDMVQRDSNGDIHFADPLEVIMREKMRRRQSDVFTSGGFEAQSDECSDEEEAEEKRRQVAEDMERSLVSEDVRVISKLLNEQHVPLEDLDTSKLFERVREQMKLQMKRMADDDWMYRPAEQAR